MHPTITYTTERAETEGNRTHYILVYAGDSEENARTISRNLQGNPNDGVIGIVTRWEDGAKAATLVGDEWVNESYVAIRWCR